MPESSKRAALFRLIGFSEDTVTTVELIGLEKLIGIACNDFSGQMKDSQFHHVALRVPST